MANAIEVGGEYDCKTAEQFLDRLSPRYSSWQPTPSVWIFRGQAGDWPLLPKAYRCNGAKFAAYNVPCFIAPGETTPRQSAYNTAFDSLMTKFRVGMDANGLVIPSAQPPMFEHGPACAPPGQKLASGALPLFALAQHFGLPTPLLDWSRRAHVAAYFSLPSTRVPDGLLYVWALRQDVLPIRVDFQETGKDAESSFMTIETAPRSSNPNLHAQAGLFTFIQGTAAHDFTIQRYVEQVASTLFTDDKAKKEYTFLVRLTLPSSEAPKLRRLLAEEGIDGAAMFPGYDGVVRAMKERTLWDTP
ncbi:MAG: FRG domain-containing protein [Pseudomonadota bacterium]